MVLYPCMFCVALLMDLFALCVACLTVFVNCPSGRLGAPSICFVCVFVCRRLSPHIGV